MPSRTSVIVILLAASFLTTTIMTMRAVNATRYHQTTAEGVIRDWARVAGEEFVRRAGAQIGFYGCYPVTEAIAAGNTPPASALVRRSFRVDTRHPSSDLPAAVRMAVREHLMINHDGATIYYLGVRDRNPPPAVVGAVEVEPRAFAPYCATVMTRPLLPRSLVERHVTNDAIFIRIADTSNRTLFSTGGRFDPTLGIRRTLPTEDGFFAHFTLESSIARSVAPRIVFGGVPRPALPIYASMLIVNAGLLATAIFQLRKERALARLRSDFISGVSHELRTPLTQIRMFTETLLLDRVRNDDERRRSLRIVDQEARRLAHLVENVLQFSRGERGTLRVAREQRDLVPLMRETLDAFLPIAKARGATIDLELPEEFTANVDGDAMRQVLLNLLDNAVKYGPPNQRVIVGIRDGALFVDDEGPGIPPNERKRIFERYRRLDRERGRAIAGMGIGLSVVRELVALHGGSVRVEEGLRGGSRFVVTV